MAKFNFFRIFSIVLIILLTSCQLKEPSKNHGILFLENRAEKLIVGKDNKNDILRKIGNPHISTNKKDNRWIYIERVLTKGSIHKIGAYVQNKPSCNGWTYWFVKQNNKLISINVHRNLIREEISSKE